MRAKWHIYENIHSLQEIHLTIRDPDKISCKTFVIVLCITTTKLLKQTKQIREQQKSDMQ